MFFLVSGAAASGKSTVARGIRGRLANTECHDDDEWNGPDGPRPGQFREWVAYAVKCQDEGRDFLLASHSPLGQLLACRDARRLVGISACVLDCYDPVRIQRMRDRGIDPRWPPNQDTVSWAAWHRMHAHDPQWEQHVVFSRAGPEYDYTAWTHWQRGDPRWRVLVIDTTSASAEEVIDRVATWVREEQHAQSLLTPATTWWDDTAGQQEPSK